MRLGYSTRPVRSPMMDARNTQKKGQLLSRPNLLQGTLTCTVARTFEAIVFARIFLSIRKTTYRTPRRGRGRYRAGALPFPAGASNCFN